MNKTLTILAASTALAAILGVPAMSAIRGHLGDSDGFSNPIASMLHFVSDDDDDDDDDENEGYRTKGDDDDDDECDDDEGSCNGANNPAPAGTVAPPQNGLFGNGTPPQVQVN